MRDRWVVALLLSLAGTAPSQAQGLAGTAGATRDVDPGHLRILLADAPRESAPGQNRGLESIVVDLEKRLRQLESVPVAYQTQPDEVLDPRPVISGLAAPALRGFKDGFLLRSHDNQHQLRITGQIQTDYRAYPMPGDTTDIDTFLIRRARLGIEANVFDHYQFRLLPQWGSTGLSIQDAFMNVHYWDEFQFEAGKFRVPISYEKLIQDRFVPTLERSLVDQVVPEREVGLMFHGQKVYNQFDYAFGVFNGQPNGATDNNKTGDFAGRIAWRPFDAEYLPEALRRWQFGISATTGVEQGPIDFNGSATPNVLRTPSNISWLTFNNTVRADGLRTRVTPEVSYFFRSLGFAAQYIRMDQEMNSGAPGAKAQDIRFEGYYFLMTYLLTGESRTTYSEPVFPLRPFDPLHPIAKPGAWELVGRVSRLQVDPTIFRAGAQSNLADPNGNSDGATEMTFGFNWYLNALVRIQFNWEHGWYSQPLLLGPPKTYFRQTDAVLTRFQIIF